MSNNSNISEYSPESVWAILRELAARQVENERIMTERFAANALQMAENERIFTEKFAATERVLTEKFAETARQMAETDRHISRLEKQIGGVTNSHGSFAEEYFYNSIERGDKIFFGEKFDKMIKFENVLIGNAGAVIARVCDILLLCRFRFFHSALTHCR